MQRGQHADLIRALKRLDAFNDSQVLRRMAGLLGFNWVEAKRPEPERMPQPESRPSKIREDLSAAVDAVDPTTALPHDFVPAPVQPLDMAEPGRPAWLDTVTSLPLPQPEPAERLPIQPLLRERWLRAILVAALSTLSETGDVDSSRLVEIIARKEALLELPLRLAPGTAKGVHCWVDEGDGMQPFERDQEQLLAHLVSIFGASRVWIRGFTGLPPLEPGRHLAGTPLLLLTALGQLPAPGALGEALSSEWAKFAVQAKSQGASHIAALVPFTLAKCPLTLRREMAVISWDRPSSVQAVRRARAVVRA